MNNTKEPINKDQAKNLTEGIEMVDEAGFTTTSIFTLGEQTETSSSSSSRPASSSSILSSSPRKKQKINDLNYDEVEDEMESKRNDRHSVVEDKNNNNDSIVLDSYTSSLCGKGNDRNITSNVIDEKDPPVITTDCEKETNMKDNYIPEDSSSGGTSKAPKNDTKVNTSSIKPYETSIDSTPTTLYKCDDFVRKGSKLRNLVKITLNVLLSKSLAFISQNKLLLQEQEQELVAFSDGGDGNKTLAQDQPIQNVNHNRHDSMRNHVESNSHYAAEIAREKVAECLTLERQLKESQSQIKALETTNTTFRDTISQQSNRLNRTVEALKIAGTNAAIARADGDAAEAQSRNYLLQFQTIQKTLEEIRQSYDNVRMEHDEISNAARCVEGRLFVVEAELHRVNDEKRKMTRDVTHWQNQYDELYSNYQSLQVEYEQVLKQHQSTSKVLQEQKGLEQSQMDRYNRLENELRTTKNQLVECTHSAAESESTISALQRTVTELQTENRSLHGKIASTLQNSEKERQNLQESLTQVERSAQKLRLQSNAHEDDIQRYKLDFSSNEKQISQYKIRISNLERRLTEATTAFGSNNGIASNTNSTNVCWKKEEDTNDASIPALSSSSSSQDNNSSKKITSSSTPFMIPPLRSSTFMSPPQHNNTTITHDNNRNNNNNNENNNSYYPTPDLISRSHQTSKSNNSSPCCICQKNPFGLMKPCQCGQQQCNKRAHATCISKKFRNVPGGQHRNGVVLCGSTIGE